MSWVDPRPLGRAPRGVVSLIRRVAGLCRRRSGRRAGLVSASRRTHKYQALLAPLPRPAEHAAGQRWPATWQGVARAGQATQLLTALVTTPPDDSRPPAGSPLTVTMVVVGPGDCLDVGDDFTLWQGGDIARGVVTRRLFV